MRASSHRLLKRTAERPSGTAFSELAKRNATPAVIGLRITRPSRHAQGHAPRPWRSCSQVGGDRYRRYPLNGADLRLRLTASCDRALILLGSAGALFRAELAAVELAHVNFVHEGFRLLIPAPRVTRSARGEKASSQGYRIWISEPRLQSGVGGFRRLWSNLAWIERAFAIQIRPHGFICDSPGFIPKGDRKETIPIRAP